MKNSLQSWFHPKVEKESKKLIHQIIESNFINDGPVSRKFSEELNVLVNRKYSTCVPSATAGLFTAIKSLRLNKNDAIIIPSFSFIATANSAFLATSNIYFVDIDKNNFCIDINKLEDKLNELKKGGITVGAVISVEVNGRCPDYNKLLILKKKYRFKLITDSAESLGSYFKDKPLGSIGDISVISLSPNKVISSGQGGVIFTNNLKTFKNIMAYKLNGNHIRGDGGSDKFNIPGFNFKFTDIQAAIVLPQLKSLKKRLGHILKIRSEYIKKFSKHAYFPELEHGNIPLWVDCIPHNKKNFIKILKKNSVNFREFWIPMNSQKAYFKYKTECKNANTISKRGIWLASNFDIKLKDIRDIRL